MSTPTKFLLRLTAPIITIGLLIGMVREQRTYLSEADFEPYHQRAGIAIDAVPYKFGLWMGRDEQVVREAQRLLRPNRIVQRRYIDVGSVGQAERTVSLLIVQCKRSGDMVGHYPRNCYRAIGNEMTEAIPRDWSVGGISLPIMEYHFKRVENGQSYWTIVYNFMIVPGRGIVRDMEGVKAAAEDYQQRYYGAAQFQLVFHAPLKQADRDDIFNLFLRELVPTIKTLNSGALR